MQYKLVLFLALAYTAQGLKYEEKKLFSYTAGLCNLEYYLRNEESEVKNCYLKVKPDYEKVLNNFERKLQEFSKKQAGTDKKKVVGRIQKIVTDLKQYNTKLSELLQKESFFVAAAYVDQVRLEVEKDLEKHVKNIEQPLDWNKNDFAVLERSFRPLRDRFVEEVSGVVCELAECMSAPKCEYHKIS